MATPREKKDTYVLLGTFTGNKGFRKGDELVVAFVPDIPKSVECVGPSADRKRRAAKWVNAKELADLRIVRKAKGRGRTRTGLARDLERILIQAAKR